MKVEDKSEQDEFLGENRRKNDSLESCLPLFREKIDNRSFLLNITNLMEIEDPNTNAILSSLQNDNPVSSHPLEDLSHDLSQ